MLHVRPRPPILGLGSCILLLDVDGVLNQLDNRTAPEHCSVRTMHGTKYPINFDPAIISALDQTIQDFSIEVAWLTTWGPNVETLLDQALDGQLSGGYVLEKMPKGRHGAVPADWKLNAIIQNVTPLNTRWAWADDEAIDVATRSSPGFSDGSLTGTAPRLLLPCSPSKGITFQQVEQLAAFAGAGRNSF